MSINVPYSTAIPSAFEQQITILLSDTHLSVKNAFKKIKSMYRWYEVIPATESAKGILSHLRKHPKTDLLVMPLGATYESTDLCIRLKAISSSAKVIFTVGNQPIEVISRAKRAGASGFIRQENCPREMITGIRSVMKGDTFYCEEMKNMVVQSYDESVTGTIQSIAIDELTRREIEVLRKVGQGCTAQEIADVLHISKHTVETHRRNLLQKLGLKNSLELVGFAITQGYVEWTGPLGSA